ncbi:hypothetical protein SH449x_001747 [Pirellulaceae bacterium SH449]
MLGIVDALRLLDRTDSALADSLSASVADSLLLCQAPNAPILAILGLLNAGKSSLVSTFLHESNRARVLIGSSNQQGTHRFVLWLPECWKSISLIWGSIQARLNTVFNAPLELLDADPQTAWSQYNAMDTRAIKNGDGTTKSYSAMQSPLVGFDPLLDRWGIALMDCPDIQTGLLPSLDMAVTRDRLADYVESVAQTRLQLLAKVSPFCSSFVIVLPANAMHDEKVSKLIRLLKEQMPGTPQIAAVNRVPRRYSTEEIRSEINKLYGSEELSRVYMAYNFDGPLDRERIPEGPDALSLPQFFRIDRTPVAQPPQPIPDEHWLLNIGSQLDKSQLLDGSIDSHLSRIEADMREAVQAIKARVELITKKRIAMRQTLSQACLEFSRDPNPPYALRLQASKQIVAQISQSLERTAPWWATPGRWVARIGEFGKEKVANVSQWLRFPEWISGKTAGLVQYIRGRWAAGDEARIVTAELFLKTLARIDRSGVWGLDDVADANSEQRKTELLQSIQRGIHRFQSESETSIIVQELDQFTAKIWNNMPWKRRVVTGLAPAAVLFAPLVAVIALPFDFGGSSVLVFASLQELLGAGLAGLGMALINGDSVPRVAESEAAWQQYGDLVAVLCDEVGMERPGELHPVTVDMDSEKREVPASSIARLTRDSASSHSSHSADLSLSSVAFHDAAAKEIQTLLTSLRNTR